MSAPDANRFKKRKVLVLYVGGTIGMQKNKNGVYVPVPNAFIEKIKYHTSMHDPETAKLFGHINSNQLVLPPVDDDYIILYEIQEYKPLLDSSNMFPKDWIRIAQDIEVNYNSYDGLVILHGTDTLTYTSSALSFMLHGLQKPVILTGAQISVFETRSDAQDNFLASLILAGCYDIPEVCVCFANQLMRGNRAFKLSSNALNAFTSPNYHRLVDIGIDITVHHHYIRQEEVPFKINTQLSTSVALLSFFPTLTASMIEAFLVPSLEGLVLETYGAGNIPSQNPDILQVLKKAIRRGIIIVTVTQCPQGFVNVCYETGKTLEDIGIISGRDMTSGAALTKLCYILGQRDLTHEQRIQIMKMDLKGEMTLEYQNGHTN